jgi:hypothetical protein
MLHEHGLAVNFRCIMFLLVVALFPLAGRAGVGMCVDDGDIAIAIMTNDRNEVLDLALTVGESTIHRYPEANGIRVAPPALALNFSAKRKGAREALGLDISGKQGRMRFRGKSTALECDWN